MGVAAFVRHLDENELHELRAGRDRMPEVAHARTRLQHRPYHRRRNARTAALAALQQRAHAIAYVDGEAVHYAHTRAIVVTLEGVRCPSVLRTAALLLCGSIHEDLRRRTVSDAAVQLEPGPHNLTLVRYAAEGQVPARASRCSAVQCSAVHA